MNNFHSSTFLFIYSGTNCKIMPCPSDWLEYNGICYSFFIFTFNYNSSRKFCEEKNASLLKLEENNLDFIFDTVIIKFI